MNVNLSEFQYITSLLKRVLRGEKPEELPEGLTFEGIYKKSKFHHVSGMVFYGIEQLGSKPSDNILKIWRQDRDKAIARDLQQFHEYGVLEQTFNSNKIKYIPLKGIILKKLYPSPDMRYMCDIDVITEENSHHKLRDLMIQNGYEAEHFDAGNHDEYTKKPIMNVEIHRFLFSDYTFGGKHFAKYLKNPFDFSKQTEGFRCELDSTYFFLHLLTHAAKHYINGGVGLRAFMDIWLYYKNHNEKIDLDKIGNILKDNQYKKLCFDILLLSQMWFGDKEWDNSFDEMAEYVYKGGAFGTVKSSTHNEIREKGKAKYLLTKLFPSYRTLAFSYPIIKKIPVLYPFCLILRLFTKPIINFKRTMNKLKGLFSFKK
ncbi:MAG: hypothetical protein E7509_03175 [Ruminococcus sp.]|nr:hypothetical protein [Ruminococcus sp.]